MSSPSSLDALIEALRCLPGVGPKSAQRMAYHLLQRDQRGAGRLATALGHALEVLRHCARCNTFCEDEVCARCASPQRDATELCVVEMPADLAMLEQTHSYHGMYYVLMGRHLRVRPNHSPLPQARAERSAEPASASIECRRSVCSCSSLK